MTQGTESRIKSHFLNMSHFSNLFNDHKITKVTQYIQESHAWLKIWVKVIWMTRYFSECRVDRKRFFFRQTWPNPPEKMSFSPHIDVLKKILSTMKFSVPALTLKLGNLTQKKQIYEGGPIFRRWSEIISNPVISHGLGINWLYFKSQSPLTISYVPARSSILPEMSNKHYDVTC